MCFWSPSVRSLLSSFFPIPVPQLPVKMIPRSVVRIYQIPKRYQVDGIPAIDQSFFSLTGTLNGKVAAVIVWIFTRIRPDSIAASAATHAPTQMAQHAAE